MIKIEIEDSILTFSEDVESLTKDVIVYLMSKNFKKIYQDDRILQYESNYEEKDLIEIVEKVLKHYNVAYEFSNKIKEKQQDYFEEEKAFKDFTEKARKIRNNECEVSDFKNFKESLEKNMKNRTLYGLQFLSAYHLAFSQNACNFSVPGAGKTSIVYGAYTYLNNLREDDRKRIDKILVIAPLNAFGPWEDEYTNCFGENVDSKRIIGMDKKSRERYFQGHMHSKLTLVSYPTAASSVEDIISFLKNEKVMVVLDEAHKIKNTSMDAQIAPAILKLAKYAKSKVVLTGTPAPNGYLDLYNLYEFIWPERKIIKFNKAQLSSMSQPDATITQKSMIPKLINDISPFFIRIKKSDFDNMPIPIENPLIHVKMDEKQQEIYHLLVSEIFSKYNRDIELTPFSKAKTIRLMQAATNPYLLKKPIEELNEYDIEISNINLINLINTYNYIPNKFLYCVELTKKILLRGEKVVIWANYIDNLLLIKRLFDQNNIESELLYGETPVESDFDERNVLTREKIVARFNDNNSDLKVLIANPYAASESISLHKVCHNAIYLERNFNAATFIQSKDRIHRYGLKKDDIINYYYLGAENSIDDIIDERLKIKEENMKKLIESEEIPLFSNYFDMEIDIDDIKELLKKYVNRET